MFKRSKRKENIIFVSYDENTQDSDVAEKIYEMVESIGIRVYLFRGHIEGGKDSVDKIKKAIKNSNAMVALLTNESITSSYVNQEIGFGLATYEEERVIPFVQSDLDMSLGMLEGKDRIDFNIKNPKKGLEELFNNIDKLKKDTSIKGTFYKKFLIE